MVTETGTPGGDRSFWQRGGRLWTVLLLGGLALLFTTFPSVFFGNGQFYLRDFHPFFFPQKQFLAQAVSSGTIPFWQPHVGCGVPFFSSLQPGVFYPPSVLLLVAGSFQPGFTLFIGFHFLLAFIAAGVLARVLFRADPWVCCLTGTAYAFGGFCVSSVSQLNNLQSAAWAPLVLAAVVGLLRRRRLGGLLLTAMVVALQLLGGGVEVTALTLVAALALSLLPAGRRVGQLPGSVWRSAGSGFLLVSGAILLATALSAFQVLPTAEMAGRSMRSGSDLEAEGPAAYSLQPENLQNLGTPRRLSDPGDPEYFRAFPRGRVPWLISIYQGAVVIYLALLGLLAGRRMLALRLALLACALGGLFMALGDASTLTAALWRVLPGAGWFRYPEKFVFLTALTVPLLAAMGCRGLSGTNGPQRRLTRMAAEGTALLLPLFLLALTRGSASYAVGFPVTLLLLAAATRLLAGRKLLGSATAALLLAMLVAVDLTSAHRPLNATVPADFYNDAPAAAAAIPHGPIPTRIRSTLPGCPGGPPATERPQATPLHTHLVWRAYLSPNCAGIHGISQVRGSTGMELRHPARRERVLTAAGLPQKLGLLSLWGVDYLLMDRELFFPDDLLLVTDQLDLPEQRLYRLRRPLPRLFTLSEHIAAGYPRAESKLLTSGEGAVDLVESLRADLALGRSLGEGVKVASWGTQRVRAEVETRRQGILLAFTDTHDPGWTAMVDGRPAPLFEGLGGFCLVRLPGPGSHQVELRYRPRGFVPGLAVTAAALPLFLLLALIVRRRRVDLGQGTT